MAMVKGSRYPLYYDASIDEETLDPELASDTSDGLMSKEDKVKLDRVKVGENGDVNIEVKASEIIYDENHKFVTEEQIEKWDNNTIDMEYNEEEETLIIG